MVVRQMVGKQMLVQMIESALTMGPRFINETAQTSTSAPLRREFASPGVMWYGTLSTIKFSPQQPNRPYMFFLYLQVPPYDLRKIFMCPCQKQEQDVFSFGICHFIHPMSDSLTSYTMAHDHLGKTSRIHACHNKYGKLDEQIFEMQ